jgi:tRNA(Ile)-lysidine synthase
LQKTPPETPMTRAVRRGASAFGPRWLQERLALLLPRFPDIALCVAWSGGMDSSALLAALTQLPRPPSGLRAVHIDHRLHPHSRRWSAHCRRIARALNVPLTVRSARIVRRPGESLEAVARAARYRLLAAELAAGEVLLTAHHQDDQLETVLLQLLRGAGIAGLAAMPAVADFAHGTLVRPLLDVPRAALGAWARAEGVQWVEDDTNAATRLDRNYLRARVLPPIHERWPAAAATVARAARHAGEAQRLLDVLGAADAARASCGAMLSAQVLRTLPAERRRNALRFWITSAGYLAPPTSRLEEIAGALLAARADRQPQVAWEGVLLQRQGDRLSLRPGTAGHAANGRAAAAARIGRTRSAAPAAQRTPPTTALAVTWCWRERRVCVLPAPFGKLAVRRDARGPLDLDALSPTLTLRARRGGERLRPVRGGARRTLKSLLQEAHVPVGQRAQLPLVFAGERLVAAADLWLDESVQAHGASRRRGRLVWSAGQMC